MMPFLAIVHNSCILWHLASQLLDVADTRGDGSNGSLVSMAKIMLMIILARHRYPHSCISTWENWFPYYHIFFSALDIYNDTLTINSSACSHGQSVSTCDIDLQIWSLLTYQGFCLCYSRQSLYLLQFFYQLYHYNLPTQLVLYNETELLYKYRALGDKAWKQLKVHLCSNRKFPRVNMKPFYLVQMSLRSYSKATLLFPCQYPLLIYSTNENYLAFLQLQQLKWYILWT